MYHSADSERADHETLLKQIGVQRISTTGRLDGEAPLEFIEVEYNRDLKALEDLPKPEEVK